MWTGIVTSNYDILIMTITLIVVAGLVLEVVRLTKKTVILENGLFNFDETQRVVNRLIAEDIMKLQRKLKGKNNMQHRRLKRWLETAIGLYMQKGNFSEEEYQLRLDHICQNIINECKEGLYDN